MAKVTPDHADDVDQPEPPQKLPTLEDLHKLQLDITGGTDAADYVDQLRGDDE